MLFKVTKLIASMLVTKWLADAAFRAAHDPQVENTVRRVSSAVIKKVVMTVLGVVFFSTGLVMTLMTAAAQLDLDLPMLSYRTYTALFITLGGVAMLALVYKKPRSESRFSVESRRTRPQLVDGWF